MREVGLDERGRLEVGLEGSWVAPDLLRAFHVSVGKDPGFTYRLDSKPSDTVRHGYLGSV